MSDEMKPRPHPNYSAMENLRLVDVPVAKTEDEELLEQIPWMLAHSLRHALTVLARYYDAAGKDASAINAACESFKSEFYKPQSKFFGHRNGVHSPAVAEKSVALRNMHKHVLALWKILSSSAHLNSAEIEE